MTITTRAAKGAPLTNAELDANFTDIAVGDAAALSEAKAYAESLVVGLWDDRGNYNASANTFPIAGGSGPGGLVVKGDIWTISVGGTLGGVPLAPRQTVRATVDSPGQLLINWAVGLANTDLEDAITPGITGRAPSQNAVANALALKANLASPTFTGTVGGISAAMVGLANVTNTSDLNKPVSAAQQAAFDLKQDVAAEDASNGYPGLTSFNINFKNVMGTVKSFFSNANSAARTYTFQDRNGLIADDTDLALKAPLASPTFTGTVSGVTAAMVGLGNANNTSDANKPVSTAQQAALNAKAQLGGSGTQDFAVGSLNGGPLAGMRNRVINGGMAVDQRNQGAITSGSGFMADRFPIWLISGGSARFASQRVADAPPGFSTSAKVTVTAAQPSLGPTEFFSFNHTIEGLIAADLDFGLSTAKTVTVSFWVKSSVAGLYSCAILNLGSTRCYVSPYTINNANTWEQKTFTFAGDTTGTWMKDSTSGLFLYFSLGMGASYTSPVSNTWTTTSYTLAGTVNLLATNGATFQITGVQLETGSVATPFERRPYSIELLLCQRDYEIGAAPLFYINTIASTIAYGEIRFAVTKRGGTTIKFNDWEYYSTGINARVKPDLSGSSNDRFAFTAINLSNWNGWAGVGSWSAATGY